MLARNASTAEKTRKAIAQNAIRSSAARAMLSGSRTVESVSVWFDKGLRQTHRLGVGKRLIDLLERVGARSDRLPRDRAVVRLEDSKRADEMCHLAGPAPSNFEV